MPPIETKNVKHKQMLGESFLGGCVLIEKKGGCEQLLCGLSPARLQELKRGGHVENSSS